MSRSPRTRGKYKKHKPSKFYAINGIPAATVRHGKFCPCCWNIPISGFKQRSHRFIRRHFKILDEQTYSDFAS